jgi:hypothetical protein
MRRPFITRRLLPVALFAAAGIASIAVARRVGASDHMDTPEVELNPRMDINDVYAFPGSSADRIALILTTSSPIAGQSASFDPNVLYQFKIDNTGDAVEDLVIQVTFDGGTGAAQTYTVRGPVAPTLKGMTSSVVATAATITGKVGTAAGSASFTQVFAGLRADPFVIDLEQFFAIIPDRRPSTGALSTPATATASAFRTPGIDFLNPFNALSIVVELPKGMLQPSTDAAAKFGVWATTSR